MAAEWSDRNVELGGLKLRVGRGGSGRRRECDVRPGNERRHCHCERQHRLANIGQSLAEHPHTLS